MGWASGSWLAEGVWKIIRKYIPENQRAKVAKQIIEAFRSHDWDTVDEAETLATDAHWWNEEEYDAICIDEPKDI
jgi:hypothetical protein